MHSSKRNHWCRHKAFCKIDPDAVCTHHTRRGFSKKLTRETTIVPKHHAKVLGMVIENILGPALRNALYIFYGEFVGNDAAPAVCSKLDLVSHDDAIVAFYEAVF